MNTRWLTALRAGGDALAILVFVFSTEAVAAEHLWIEAEQFDTVKISTNNRAMKETSAGHIAYSSRVGEFIQTRISLARRGRYHLWLRGRGDPQGNPTFRIEVNGNRLVDHGFGTEKIWLWRGPYRVNANRPFTLKIINTSRGGKKIPARWDVALVTNDLRFVPPGAVPKEGRYAANAPVPPPPPRRRAAPTPLNNRPSGATPLRSDPSIEEMLTVVEAELAKEAANSKPAASTLKKTTPRRVSFRSIRLKPSSEAIADLLKKLQDDARTRLTEAGRNRLPWNAGLIYLRLEDLRRAVPAWAKLNKSRNAGFPRTQGGRNYDRFALIDMNYARALTYVGNKRLAEAVYAAAVKRIERVEAELNPLLRPPASVRQNLDRLRKFMDQHEDGRGQAQALRDALAKNPNAKQQWDLIQVLDPGRQQAALPLQWLVALLEMTEQHSDHSRVKSGTVARQTVQAYRYHLLYDEAIKLLESMPAAYPKLSYARYGSSLWDLAETHMSKGRDQETRGNREAVKTYRAAIAKFNEYKQKFPKSGMLKPRKFAGRKLLPYVDERIQQANAGIGRVQSQRR